MMIRYVLAVFLAFLLCVSGSVQAQSLKAESIAVVVNDDAISMSDVEARLKLIMVSSGMPRTAEVQERLAPQIINVLIDERLMIQEAARQEIVIPPEEIEAGFAKIAGQNNMTPDQFRAVLRREGIPPKTLEDQIRSQIAWAGVVQATLKAQVRVSEGEIASAIERMRAGIGKARWLAAEIFLPVSTPADDSNVRQLAQRLSAQIKDGQVPFQRVANQFSQSAGASKGGDLGWVQEGQLAPELESVLAQMNEGELSQPVRSPDGYHILLLRKKGAVAEADVPSREGMEYRLKMEQIDRLQKRALLDLKARAFIERRGA